jgi:hypothetical protein
MKVKHTLVALALVAVLGGLLYFLMRQPEKPAEDAIPREDLFTFTPDQVAEFTIEAPAQPAATFRRLPDAAAPAPDTATPPAEGEPTEPKPEPRWEIVEPAGIAADSAQIQMFLEEIDAMQGSLLEVDGAPAWSEYGLDAPEKSYRFKLKDGKEAQFAIGKQNPGEYARYSRRDNAPPVVLIDNVDNKALIEKTLFDLRDKRILPVDITSQASRLELRFNFGGAAASAEELAKARELGLPTRSPLIVMTRDAGSGNWLLDEPRVRTDYGATGYLISTLAGGQMRSVEQETASGLAQFGLERPEIRAEVTTPAGKQSLLVGKQGTEGQEQFFYAKNSVWPHVFTILRTAYDQLNQDKEAYRNRFLFDFTTTNAKRLAIKTQSAEHVFALRGEEWFMAGSPERKMEQFQVDNFLNSIHSLRVAYYPSDAPNRFAAYGLNEPWMQIRVTFGENNQEETILFARRNNKFYAARQGEDSVYELSPNEPENLETKLKELITPQEPASAPPAPATQ